MNYETGKNCFLLHSFMGEHPREFMRLMWKQGRDPDFEKFMNFYHGGNTVEEVEKSLGLDLREITCCASKQNTAVTYHKPFGLILSGDIKVMFDGDSGICIRQDGTYPSKPYYDFAHITNLETLMTEWYKKFENSNNVIIWNEVILKKGSKIIGGFHDPSFDSESLKGLGQCTFQEKEYEKFLEKIDQLDLSLLEINAKFR